MVMEYIASAPLEFALLPRDTDHRITSRLA